MHVEFFSQALMMSSKITLTCHICVVTPKKVQTQHFPFFFNWSYKTLCTFRGFEQLSNSIGWRLRPNICDSPSEQVRDHRLGQYQTWLKRRRRYLRAVVHNLFLTAGRSTLDNFIAAWEYTLATIFPWEEASNHMPRKRVVSPPVHILYFRDSGHFAEHGVQVQVCRKSRTANNIFQSFVGCR